MMSLEDEIRKKYQFVILYSPYETIDHPLVKNLFPKIIDLKAQGYQKEYGKNVLPFDASDFIAGHLLLCESDKNADLRPILAMKSITLEKCDQYNIPFPMLGMLETPFGPNEHYKNKVREILNTSRKAAKEREIAYNGSFTIHPACREDKNLKKHLWDLTFSMLTNYYISEKINHVLAVCATTFKVHEKKQALGWNYLSNNNGTILNEYLCKSLNTPLIPMEITELEAKSATPSAKFHDLWEKRIILRSDKIKIPEAA